jgi:glycogen operon protein
MAYALEHKTHRKISTGKYHPLGATLYEEGALQFIRMPVSLSLLFDRPDGEPKDIIKRKSYKIYGIHFHGLKAGQLYAYKIKGDFNPAYGMRFNENKLLIDPMPRLYGKLRNVENLLRPITPFTRERSSKMIVTTPHVPKSMVVDDHFD